MSAGTAPTSRPSTSSPRPRPTRQPDNRRSPPGSSSAPAPRIQQDAQSVRETLALPVQDPPLGAAADARRTRLESAQNWPFRALRESPRLWIQAGRRERSLPPSKPDWGGDTVTRKDVHAAPFCSPGHGRPCRRRAGQCMPWRHKFRVTWHSSPGTYGKRGHKRIKVRLSCG